MNRKPSDDYIDRLKEAARITNVAEEVFAGKRCRASPPASGNAATMIRSIMGGECRMLTYQEIDGWFQFVVMFFRTIFTPTSPNILSASGKTSPLDVPSARVDAVT